AHTVVAGNDYLARYARQASARHVEIVPTAIDLDRYSGLRDASVSPSLTVGWIGIPLNVHYLKMIEPALRAAAAAQPIQLHVVGAAAPAEFDGIPAQSFSWS